MTDYNFTNVLVWDLLGGSVKPARNQRITVTDPATGNTAPGLRVNGQPATFVTSDSTGHITFTTTIPVVRYTAANGYWDDIPARELWSTYVGGGVPFAASGEVSTTKAVRADDSRLATAGRLLDATPSEELAFGVLDSTGRRTWLEANTAGKPTRRSGEAMGNAIGLEATPAEGLGFAVMDKDGRRTELELDLAGQVTPRVLARWADRMGMTIAPALPVADWAHWGDSLTDDLVTGADSWVTKFAAMTGRNHYNGGWYNQRAEQIAARQGALPALVTVQADTIPASGSVTVTAIRNSPVSASTTRRVDGVLAGVPGFLQEATAGTVTFTRTGTGTATPCPPGSRFTPDRGAKNRDRHVTIWAGRNNIWDTDPQLVVAAIRAQIDYLSPSVKRALVLEVPRADTNPNGSDGAVLVDAMNAAIRAAFPAEWVPVASWLRTDEAATAAGITFTADDQTDIANGVIPRSFRSDSIHLNAAGCTAVAYKVHQEAQRRGWLA